ncbi:MAG: barstar family protein [Dehalococcoidia bacterium]|jgi:RNAse (barnase) inhibitor barstar|nr:barstar family protein [Dehalococcoidia bacterium]
MEDWMTVFGSHLYSGVHVTPAETEETAIREAAAANGLDYTAIGLRDVVDKAGFLSAVATALRFPAYFGMNWDALHDCLTDLSWQPAAGYVLYFAAFRTFAQADGMEADVANHVLQSAAAFWRENEVPFFAVLAA